MSNESPHILIVDDDIDVVKAASVLLTRQGMRVTGAADPDAAWVVIAEHAIDVILLDLNFARGRTSGEEGFAMLARLITADRDAVIVVVTGHSGIAVAVAAIKGGASDFVIKPWHNDRLVATVERAVALRRARRSTAPHDGAAEPLVLLGEDRSIDHVRGVIARVAATEAAVLVRGPAGTGKSLVAQMLHRASPRGAMPMVVFDRHDGAAAVARARGGTLLIDDIDGLDLAAQQLIAASPADIRLIATSRQTRAALRSGLIDDLLFRVNTIEIDLPPLAARGDDRLRLARHFLDRFARRHARPVRPISAAAAAAIAADDWPDNVRGLRQAMERAVLLSTGEAYEIADFALSIAADEVRPRAIATDLNLAQSEKTLVEAALKRHAFNVSRAAAELGLTRAALYRRMARHGL